MQELCQAIKPRSHDLEGMQTAVKAILYHSVDNENREGNISTVKRGGEVGANFRRTRQIRQTPTTPGECGSDDHIRHGASGVLQWPHILQVLL